MLKFICRKGAGFHCARRLAPKLRLVAVLSSRCTGACESLSADRLRFSCNGNLFLEEYCKGRAFQPLVSAILGSVREGRKKSARRTLRPKLILVFAGKSANVLKRMLAGNLNVGRRGAESADRLRFSCNGNLLLEGYCKGRDFQALALAGKTVNVRKHMLLFGNLNVNRRNGKVKAVFCINESEMTKIIDLIRIILYNYIIFGLFFLIF